MKKFFTLLFVSMAAIIASAADYNVPVIVSVNGVTSEQPGVFTVNENGGLYDINLKSFMLQSEDGPMGVGNVELKGIKPYQDGNATLLVTSDLVTITDGDDPNVPFWMASMLPPVYVELRGKIEDDRLRFFLDIDLTEALGQIIQVAIGDGYQIANQGFETWHNSTGNYVEPNAWHSFESATGSLASLAGHHIEKSADAHSGEACARIYATSLFGIVANGTMTTGRMNAGSMSAANTANHAYLDMSATDVDGNGDPFYTPLCSHPDSIAFWVKFKQGTPNNAHPYATMSAIITDGTRYQDPEDQAYTNVVAKAQNREIATTDGQWVRVVAPFVYTENAVSPKAILVTLSTNADPGSGSANDELLVDDAELIYNAGLKSLKIKGQDVPEFANDKTSYTMSFSETLTANDIEAEPISPAVTVMKDIKQTEDGTQCVVTAFSGDFSKAVVYTVTMSGSTAIKTVSTAAQQQSDVYSLDGRQVKQQRGGQIYLLRQANGTVVKVRR